MDSLTRGDFIHDIPFNSFTSIRTKPSSILFSNAQPRVRVRVRVKISSSFNPQTHKNPILQKLKTTAGTLILTAATTLMIAKFSQLPARAESPVAVVEQEQEEQTQEEGESQQQQKNESPLSQFIESHSEAVDALKSLLEKKLEDGEDEEALKVLNQLISAQPKELEWKFLKARLLNEIGEKSEARKVYEEILFVDPLCFDALFQNAVLMDQCGEGQAALSRLEETLKLAQGEEKETEARNVRFVLAQIQYLQKNVDEALRSYEELAKEDPKDYRPYFYQFVIYSLLDRNDEAKAQFAKCLEVCPKDFKVEGFLESPLSRTKLFGSDDN